MKTSMKSQGLQVSSCCKAPLKVVTEVEGTSCYICTYCLLACDPYTEPIKIPYKTNQNHPAVKAYVKAVKKGLQGTKCNCSLTYNDPDCWGEPEPGKDWSKEFDKKFRNKCGLIVLQTPNKIKKFIADTVAQNRADVIEEIKVKFKKRYAGYEDGSETGLYWVDDVFDQLKK